MINRRLWDARALAARAAMTAGATRSRPSASVSRSPRDGARPASAAQSTAMQLAAGGAAVFAASLAGGELAGRSGARLPWATTS